MHHILLDTDVILDFLFDRKPFSEDSAKLLSLCEKGEIKGFVTAIMLSNIYYLLRKSAKHEKVIESLKSLLLIFLLNQLLLDLTFNLLSTLFSHNAAFSGSLGNVFLISTSKESNPYSEINSFIILEDVK